MTREHRYSWVSECGIIYSHSTQFALDNHRYANCGYNVRLLDNELTISCYSYSTPVLDIVVDINTKDTVLYSAYYEMWSPTTRKHIGYFLRAFHLNVNYHTIKECAKKDRIYNTYFNDTKLLLHLVNVAYNPTIS